MHPVPPLVKACYAAGMRMPETVHRGGTVLPLVYLAADTLQRTHQDPLQATEAELVAALERHVPVRLFGEVEATVFVEELRLVLRNRYENGAAYLG